ncbi:MAG: DUF4386 domain-containing protein [Flavobacteriales bacterium]|nr:DUF4386 domain-containing protein [Flavobacteriales bacterium]
MKTTLRTYGGIAGIALLVMGLTAGYSYGYVFNNLFMPDDAEATLTNIQGAQLLFESGILGWLIILLTDVLVAWSLFKYFEPIDARISTYTGVLRGSYSLVLAYAIYHLLQARQILITDHPDASQLMNSLDGFESYWSHGLILFGLHLIGVGYLSLRSGAVPKWLGILLWIAGVSYSLIHLAKAFAPEVSKMISILEMILGAPMAIAELGFAVWLIWKGGKINQQRPSSPALA